MEVSEYHTPEFRTTARVAADGSVTLPMIGAINLGGMDEQSAARAIEAQLVARGKPSCTRMVSVLVTAYAGQDVSVLGRGGPPRRLPVHDPPPAASTSSRPPQGLSANAGRPVEPAIFSSRSDPKTPHPVVLDPGGTDTDSGPQSRS